MPSIKDSVTVKMMYGSDADVEWSDEEMVKSGSATAISDTDFDDHVNKQDVNTTVIEVTAKPTTCNRFDPVDSILDRIDAEIGYIVSQPINGAAYSSTSSKKFLKGADEKGSEKTDNHSEKDSSLAGTGHDNGLSAPNHNHINTFSETDDHTSEVEIIDYSRGANHIKDYARRANRSDLDSVTAQQVDEKFKEIMRKKKAVSRIHRHMTTDPPLPYLIQYNDLNIHNSTWTQSAPMLHRAKKSNQRESKFSQVTGKVLRNSSNPTQAATPSIVLSRPVTTSIAKQTHFAPGYSSDVDSVKTEDFESKFQDLIVDPTKPALTNKRKPDKNTNEGRKSENGNLVKSEPALNGYIEKLVGVNKSRPGLPPSGTSQNRSPGRSNGLLNPQYLMPGKMDESEMSEMSEISDAESNLWSPQHSIHNQPQHSINIVNHPQHSMNMVNQPQHSINMVNQPQHSINMVNQQDLPMLPDMRQASSPSHRRKEESKWNHANKSGVKSTSKNYAYPWGIPPCPPAPYYWEANNWNSRSMSKASSSMSSRSTFDEVESLNLSTTSSSDKGSRSHYSSEHNVFAGAPPYHYPAPGVGYPPYPYPAPPTNYDAYYGNPDFQNQGFDPSMYNPEALKYLEYFRHMQVASQSRQRPSRSDKAGHKLVEKKDSGGSVTGSGRTDSSSSTSLEKANKIHNMYGHAKPRKKDLIEDDQEGEQFPFSRYTFNKKLKDIHDAKPTNNKYGKGPGPVTVKVPLMKTYSEVSSSAMSSSSLGGTSLSHSDFISQLSTDGSREGPRVHFTSNLPLKSALKHPSRYSLARTTSIDSTSSSLTSTSSPGDLAGPMSQHYPRSTSAKQVLSNLGFCDAASFLPERFANDWYDKLQTNDDDNPFESRDDMSDMEEADEGSLANLVTPVSSYRMRQEMARKALQRQGTSQSGYSRDRIDSDMIGTYDMPVRGIPHALKRRATMLTLHQQTAPDTSQQPSTDSRHQPYPLQHDNSIDDLKAILVKQANILSLGGDTLKERKRHRFASARQISLPLHLETLNEEDEHKKSKTKPWLMKMSSMKSFLEEEEKQSSTRESSSEASLDEPLTPITVSENFRISNVSPTTMPSWNREPSVHPAAENKIMSGKSPEQIPVPSIVITEKESESTSSSLEKSSDSETPSRRHGASLNTTSDSLEVEDILTKHLKSEGHVEPALVSHVLKDVSRDLYRLKMKQSMSLGADLNEDRLTIPSPTSSSSVSPIPVSPITVIEATLDNQNESLDVEEERHNVSNDKWFGFLNFNNRQRRIASINNNNNSNSVVTSTSTQSNVISISRPNDNSKNIDEKEYKKASNSVSSRPKLDRMRSDSLTLPVFSSHETNVNSGRMSPLVKQLKEMPTVVEKMNVSQSVQADDGHLSPIVKIIDYDHIMELLADIDEVYMVKDQITQCDIPLTEIHNPSGDISNNINNNNTNSRQCGCDMVKENKQMHYIESENKHISSHYHQVSEYTVPVIHLSDHTANSNATLTRPNNLRCSVPSSCFFNPPANSSPIVNVHASDDSTRLIPESQFQFTVGDHEEEVRAVQNPGTDEQRNHSQTWTSKKWLEIHPNSNITVHDVTDVSQLSPDHASSRSSLYVNIGDELSGSMSSLYVNVDDDSSSDIDVPSSTFQDGGNDRANTNLEARSYSSPSHYPPRPITPTPRSNASNDVVPDSASSSGSIPHEISQVSRAVQRDNQHINSEYHPVPTSYNNSENLRNNNTFTHRTHTPLYLSLHCSCGHSHGFVRDCVMQGCVTHGVNRDSYQINYDCSCGRENNNDVIEQIPGNQALCSVCSRNNHHQ